RLRPHHVHVPVPSRPDLRARDPRRRDQPREPEGAERAARGDGGAPGDRRGRDAAAARAVLRHRDAEPAAPGGHLPAARIAARPVPHADQPRLSGREGGARAAARRGPARPDRAPAARDHADAAPGAAGERARPAGLRRAPRLRAGAHQPHAPLAALHAGPLAARRCRDPARGAGLGAHGRTPPGAARGRAGHLADGGRASPARQCRRGEERLRSRARACGGRPDSLSDGAPASVLADFRQSVSDWIFRAAVPEPPPVTLGQRRIFILPTRQGYAFALMLLLLLLASINYSLSLGFLLTFLLGSMAAVG